MEHGDMDRVASHSGVLSFDTRQSMDYTNNEQFVGNSSSGILVNLGSLGTLLNSSLGRSTSALTNESRQDSLSRISGTGSRRRASQSLPRDLGDIVLEAISLSRELASQILGGVDSSLLAQTGDSGDCMLVNDRGNDDENLRTPTDKLSNFENGLENSSYDEGILSDRVLSQSMETTSPSYLLEEDRLFPPSPDLLINSAENDKTKNMHFTPQLDKQDRWSPRLAYISYLTHLAVFGILGVLTRYSLEKLFGPNLLALTRDDTPLYLDLPSNMLGSFLMGWFGIVFKADLRYVSEHLVIGVTTGYMGSLTTFSGWNQKMLNLSSKDHWTFAVAGIILGMFIVNECVNIGVESAEHMRRCFLVWIQKCPETTKIMLRNLRLDNLKRHVIATIFLLVLWLSLWSLSCVLAIKRLHNVTNGATLWLGCLVGPPGVWARWYLSRLNGQGLGKKRSLKWLPIGTLLANFIAACLMAALSTISNAVNTKRCGIIVSGVQFGFLGCLSTVSTFVAEVYAMRQTGHPGRALAYAALTILPSFAAGILIYSVPVWTKHYS